MELWYTQKTFLRMENPFIESLKLDSVLEILMGPGVVWALVGLVLVLYSVISLMLLYHWREYAISPFRAKKIMRIYFGVSLSLIVTILIAAAVYSS